MVRICFIGNKNRDKAQMSSKISKTKLIAILVLQSVQFALGILNHVHSLTLDTNRAYTLYWNFNDTHITFEVQVQTRGWIGLGISVNGKMYPADVVIGWVKNGKSHLYDYHTTAYGEPVMDTQQDWVLLHGEENDSHTILKFNRQLHTCDDDDIIISDQTIRLIYAYHSEDPSNGRHIRYHGFERRGSRSVSLLSTARSPISLKDEDLKYIDLRNRNYEIPSRDTTYLCSGFQLPDLRGKHHVIGFEPIFTPGNEQYVHHLDILKCRGSYPLLDMSTDECLDDWPRGWPVCAENLLAWGNGGGAFYFPEHTGYSIGADDDAVFYVMQIHYNNPARRAGVIDSSGIRLKLTSKLRQFDVGNIMLGHMVTILQVIPPREQAFRSRAYCAEQCLTSAMDAANITEFKVIAAYQHAHTLAAGITTRHFRNGIELPPIIHDPYYDFFFQEIRQLRQEVTVKQGDSLMVECTYNSMSRSNATFATYNNIQSIRYSVIFSRMEQKFLSTEEHVVVGRWRTDKETDAELLKKFRTMNWEEEGVRKYFKVASTNSTTMHVCEKRNEASYMKEYYKFRETGNYRSVPENKQACG